MGPGDIVADRYFVERLGGSGGMGKVFVARDASFARVAIKVLHGAQDDARFQREGRLLARLRHPGIVRYIEHGATPAGEAFLVTEWLEGETLSERLARGTLSIEEALAMASRVASALGAAHRQGVVHRDIKPSNLFLVGGSVSDVRILDFGVARADTRDRTLTMTGAMLGTVGYMAPEQARGERVDTRADVFSLGCVLIRSLTGKAAFTGDDMLTVLLKVVMEEAPRLADLLPDVPPALDALVTRMMAKDPEDRPRDGEATARALAEIEGAPSSRAAPSSARPRAELATSERRVLAMVVTRTADVSPDSTTVPTSERESQERLLHAARRAWQGRLDHLADGSLVITLTSADAATDLAAQAARCALSLRAHIDMPMCVVLGWGETHPRVPVGDLIDRAVGLLALARPGVVRIDAVVAGLLDATFEVEEDATGLVLRGERDPADPAPRLLGRATACVGREREIGLLEATLTECVEDSVARAVLVLGEPGMGKSRLRQELLRRVRQRGVPVEPWIARGDPMSRGSAFCLLAQAIRRATGVSDGETLDVRRRKLHEGVARRVAEADVTRVTEFLGELVDAPIAHADASAELLAARRDPLALGEQMRRALETFLLAESAARPVMIVLEDLHWGDLPTVSFIGAVLRTLSERPIFVLALARPEVHAVFPRLWAGQDVQEIRLPKLTRRAGERLVRRVLGEDTPQETITRVVDRADGNAFYLEELIRAEAEHRGGALPETVLAMVQSRLEAMESGARRVLRAASVFGRTFCRGGLVALLGRSLIDEWLATLEAREVISPAEEARFPGEIEHSFRHAFVHEAAYAMLTEDDRAHAHRLAGAWLEAAGEMDAVVLAQHFERGGEPARAAACCHRAAAQALRGNDIDTAIALGVRGLRLGAPPAIRTKLETTLLEAYGWRDDWAAAGALADEVFQREPPGTVPWCMAAVAKIWAGPTLERYDSLAEAVGALRDVEPAADAHAALVHALGAAVTTMIIAGMHDIAGAYLERMREVGSAAFATDPFARGWMDQARGFWLRHTAADPFGSLRAMRASAEAFTAGHNPQQAMFAEVQAAIDAWHMGAWDTAREMLGPALRESSATTLLDATRPKGAQTSARGSNARLVAVVGAYVIAMIELDQGRLDEASAAAAFTIREAEARKNRYMEGLARTAVAMVALHRSRLSSRGDLEGAAGEANAAANLLLGSPAERAMALAVLSSIRLAEGRSSEAVALAEEAHAASNGAPTYARALIALARIEALAVSDLEASIEALVEARDLIRARAARIADPSMRASFLERVPQNARTLDLARRARAGTT